MSMYKAINPDNFGVLKSKIPEDLKNKLLEESKSVIRDDNEMISGLSYPGGAKHYYVNSTFKELENYIKDFTSQYEKHFPGIANLRVLTSNLPFVLTRPWFNFQKKGEYLPQHNHDGLFSYNIWLKIPYEYDEEVVRNANHIEGDVLRCFEFTYMTTDGRFKFHKIPLSKDDEGTIVMFPAKLPHIVYPFHSSDGIRISVAGNIAFKSDE